MKVVMTLLVRDEADVIDAQLAFHLNAGVDLVIATDNDSKDGTTEILESYERDGYLELLRSPAGDFPQSDLVTRMARLASTRGADWVINSDADEFWWPRGGRLDEILGEIPPDYGVVGACVRTFVPRPSAEGEGHFAERMTVRASPHAPLFEPTSVFRPVSKVIHRAHSEITVGAGSHAIAQSQLPPLRGWYPVELLHFPWRSVEQVTRKAAIQSVNRTKMRRPPRGYVAAVCEGTLGEWFERLAVSEQALTRGLAEGSLTVDTRLRDALRSLAGGPLSTSPTLARRREASSSLAFAAPDLADEAAYAVDTAVLAETEILRAQKRLDALDARVAALERRIVPRITSRLRRNRARTEGDPRS